MENFYLSRRNVTHLTEQQLDQLPHEIIFKGTRTDCETYFKTLCIFPYVTHKDLQYIWYDILTNEELKRKPHIFTTNANRR